MSWAVGQLLSWQLQSLSPRLPVFPYSMMLKLQCFPAVLILSHRSLNSFTLSFKLKALQNRPLYSSFTLVTFFGMVLESLYSSAFHNSVFMWKWLQLCQVPCFSICRLAYSVQLSCVNIIRSCHLTCTSGRIGIWCFVLKLNCELHSWRGFSIAASTMGHQQKWQKVKSLNICGTLLPCLTNSRACCSTSCRLLISYWCSWFTCNVLWRSFQHSYRKNIVML